MNSSISMISPHACPWHRPGLRAITLLEVLIAGSLIGIALVAHLHLLGHLGSVQANTLERAALASRTFALAEELALTPAPCALPAERSFELPEGHFTVRRITLEPGLPGAVVEGQKLTPDGPLHMALTVLLPPTCDATASAAMEEQP